MEGRFRVRSVADFVDGGVQRSNVGKTMMTRIWRSLESLLVLAVVALLTLLEHPRQVCAAVRVLRKRLGVYGLGIPHHLYVFEPQSGWSDV